MSSEQTFSTSDLRSTAQDYKRDAARKHKWALGPTEVIRGRAEEKPRPHRPAETQFNFKRHTVKSAVAAQAYGAKGEKVARKMDMLEGNAGISDDSANSASDDYEESGTISPPEGVMYSFDAKRAPSEGSQILNVALAKAVERFEERETIKLVNAEYDVLDTAGESVVQPSSGRKAHKGKGKAPVIGVPDADDDYEII